MCYLSPISLIFRRQEVFLDVEKLMILVTGNTWIITLNFIMQLNNLISSLDYGFIL